MPGLSDILPALHRRSSNIRERLRTISTRSSASSLRANVPASETYQPYSVYHHISSAISTMPVPPVLAVLQEPSAAKHLLEAILESPNGRRALSRLARTCRAWLDPALDVLWRELDSFVPLIGLFPPILLKKTKKPGLGLATLPKERDWDKVLKYGTRVRKITYDEVTTVVSASIFPIFEDLRPRTYILPNLENLTWRISSPENLDRATMFLCPELEGLDLHLGVAKTKFATLPAFLADLGTRIKLKSFSLTGATAIPDAFTNLLQRQDCLERLTLLAPGALSPNAGRWIAYLPRLKRLQLDLSSRSLIPVNGFFDQIRSGDATPDSLESHTDSGVFSADEADFAEVRKAALRITEDARVSSGAFGSLTQLHLTGSVGNIAAFLGHLNCALAQLELVIEDPPDAAEWRQLCGMFGDRFGDSLVSLNISATLSSKFSELVRSTSRAAPAPSRLNLEHLSSLPFLRYLSIDLPESILFTATDVARLSEVAPSLQDLRLSPLARFTSTAPPQLTLDALAPLVRNCPRLASLAVVINANVGSADITATSEVFRWLHVGHSWVSDSLQVAILLSQFAPNLEAVKWYTERNRPGFNEANSRGWQQVAEILPHLQQLRRNERKAAMQFRPPPIILPPPPPIIEKEMVIEYVEVAAPRPVMADKSIDATVSTAECGIEARPAMADMSVQAVPTMSSRQVQAVQKYASISVDATPEMKEIQVDATVTPTRSSAGVQTTVKTPDELASSPTRPSCAPSAGTHSLSLSSILSLVGMLRTMMLYPFTLPLRIVSSAVELVKRKPRTEEGGDVALDTLNVRS